MSEQPNVLITGASRGFGRMTAEALAERGAIVYATMRGTEEKNAEAADELRAWAERGERGVHVLELDVTDDASVASAVARAVDLGGIDVVLNNAGVGSFGVVESFTPDQVAWLFDVNVVGAHRVTRAALPHLRETGRGVVVFVSSGLGRIVLPFMGPYNAAKHALEGLAETWAYELRPLGIETVIVEPGAYGTGFGANMAGPEDEGRLASYGPVADAQREFGARFEARHESGEIGRPTEVVEALVDLVYAEPGTRPLRLPVGDDLAEALGAVNGTRAQVQARVFEALGVDRMLGFD